MDKPEYKRSISADKIGAAVGEGEVNIENQDLSTTIQGDNITQNITYNLAESTQNPTEITKKHPLVKLLSEILDRNDQSAMLESSLTNAVCRCFVMECTNADAPEFFAHKIKALAHMQYKGFSQLTEHSFKPITFGCRLGSRSFFEELEDVVGEEIPKWLKKDDELKVVFISSSDWRNVVKRIENIMVDITTLNAELSDQANIAPCIIIVPFYRGDFNWLAAKIAQFQIHKLQKRGLVQLPQLSDLSVHHLRAFSDELPSKAREDFKSAFKDDDINQDFYQCMKENDAKKYRDIKPDFERILQKYKN
jgi:hypothetical protein